MDPANHFLDPFGRSTMPGSVAVEGSDSFSREARVAMLGEFFADLMGGRMPRRECVVFAAGGALAWLEEGGRVGDLERLYWKITQCRRSTATPSRVWRSTCRERQSEPLATTEAPPHSSPK